MFRLSKYLIRRFSNIMLNKKLILRGIRSGVPGFNMIFRKSIDNSLKEKLIVRGFKGGVPGCNMPFPKALDNPMRFTLFYLLAGVVAWGAPWLVIMHIMLKPYDYVVD